MGDLIRHGSVASVSCAGHEIVRRIFVTVRDRNWQEVAPTQWESSVDESRQRVSLSARHTSDLVNFEWRGALHVSEDARELRFEFAGKVLRDMQVCRLGLIVLHPVEPLLGAAAATVGPDGAQRFAINEQIHPQPIVGGVPLAMCEPFSELVIERSDVGLLRLRFEGDLFELEDQRNWGDASFKTYCTPLRLGFPRTVAAGTVVAHSVTASFEPARAASPGSRRGTRPPGQPLAASPQGVRFPLIGCEAEGGERAGSRFAAPWSHIQVVLRGADGDLLSDQLASISTSTPLELRVAAEDVVSLGTDVLASLRRRVGGIARVLVDGPASSLPSASAMDQWGIRFGSSSGSDVPVFAATRGYYVEHNRDLSADARLAGIAFPLTATVHSDDRATVVDNIPTIQDMAQTARVLTQHARLAISPLGLYFPAKNPPHAFPAELVAPWLTATLIHAALAGIESVTVANDVVSALAASSGELLQQLTRCASSDLLPLNVIAGPMVHTVVHRDPTGARCLIANVGDATEQVQLAGIGLRVGAVQGARVAGSMLVVPALGVAWVDLHH